MNKRKGKEKEKRNSDERGRTGGEGEERHGGYIMLAKAMLPT